MVYTKHIRLYKNIQKSDCKLINMYAFCVYCVINPRRACAAWVTIVVLCVCVSVCLCVYDYSRTIYRLRGGLLAILRASVLQGQEKLCGDFAETTAFERYGVKTS